MINNITTSFINGSSGQLVKGQVVRATTANKNVTKAFATSDVGVQGLIGVVETGVVNAGGPISVCLFGQQFVLLDTGLTPVSGQTLYLSSLTTGLATNIPPASFAIPIGTIEDATNYAITGGVVANISPSLVPVVPGGGTANWALGITRVYAVDSLNGSDANKGYADPASTSTADYAIACAAAGLVAKKTFSGLGAIFPRVGAGRLVEVVAANGGVNTVKVYGESLESAIGGNIGYRSGVAVRGTGTNTTAGCTAFDGSASDCIYQGAITATGMNAAGYHPTGAPTTTGVQCLTFAGGAPGFAAEAAATMPLGAIVRFDANTTTAALRNIRRKVEQVTGADTVTFATALSAVPVAADTFYIEMPGVTLTTCVLGNNCTQATPAGAGGAGTITGIAFSGLTFITEGRLTVAGSWFTGLTAQDMRINCSATYTHPVRGTIATGGSRSAGSFTATNCVTSMASLHVTTSVAVNVPSTLSILAGTVIGTNLTIAGAGLDVSTPAIGTTTAVVSVPVRILAGGILINGSRLAFGQVEINNNNGLIIVQGGDNYIDLGIAQANTALTGSGTFGMYLGPGSGNLPASKTKIRIANVLPAFVQGILLGDGVNSISWAAAAGASSTFGNGFTDNAGNNFAQWTTGNGVYGGTVPLKFGGVLLGGAAATLTYLADAADSPAGGAPGCDALGNITTPMNYPGSGFMVVFFGFKPRINTMTQTCTAKLFKNGTAVTSFSLNITAGSTALVTLGTIVSGGHFLAGTDAYDVRLDAPLADVGHILVGSATLGIGN